MQLRPDDKTEANWETLQYEKFIKTLSNCETYIRDKKAEIDLKKAQTFRMEKVCLPKFDGNIRNYSRFKKDFTNLVLPHIAAEQAAFTLRQCLSDDVMVYLGNDDDVSSMLKLLETRFGDPGKLIESVIGEIQRFKRLDLDDSKKIIKFINVLDTGYRDLRNLD